MTRKRRKRLELNGKGSERQNGIWCALLGSLTLGREQMRVWKLGVASTRRGEKARLTSVEAGATLPTTHRNSVVHTAPASP